MAFDSSKFGKIDTGFNIGVLQLFGYSSTVDNEATVVASGYFNSITGKLRKNDIIFVEASDKDNIVKITSATGAATVTVASIIDASLVAAGSIDNSHVNATAAIAFSKLAALTSANILVGSAGNVATSVAVTGDIAISNAGVTSISAGAIVDADVNAAAAIAFSKLAALPAAQLLVGSAGNVATAVALSGDATIIADGTLTIAAGAIDNGKVNAAAAIAFSKLAALPSAQILVGSAGNVATAVAMSGDIAIDNTGATTIQAGAVDEAMINPNTLTGTVAANVANINVTGGLPLMFRIVTVAGATASIDVAMTHKVRVLDAWAVAKGLGTAGDTIVVGNGASAITNAMDGNVADTTVIRAGTIDDANHEIAAAGNLRVTVTDGGGADIPAYDVYVLAIRVA